MRQQPGGLRAPTYFEPWHTDILQYCQDGMLATMVNM